MVVITFPLLLLEEKALKRVFNMMSTYQKLALSLCSRKTTNLIKSLCADGPVLIIIVSEIISLRLLCIGSSALDLEFQEGINNGGEIRQVHGINGESENGWLTMRGFKLRDWIQHVAELFNHRGVYYIKFHSDMDQYTFRTLKEAIRPLPVFGLKPSSSCSNTFNLKIFNEFSEAEQINVDTNPYRDKISIRKILMSNYHLLITSYACRLSLDDLLASNVLNISTHRGFLSVKNLNRFLKLWIRGSNQKLESLLVRYPVGAVLDDNQILKGIDHLKVEDTKLRVHRRTLKSSREFHCYKGGYDIRRKDGTVGTIILNTPRSAAFKFFVWHPYLNDDQIF